MDSPVRSSLLRRFVGVLYYRGTGATRNDCNPQPWIISSIIKQNIKPLKKESNIFLGFSAGELRLGAPSCFHRIQSHFNDYRVFSSFISFFFIIHNYHYYKYKCYDMQNIILLQSSSFKYFLSSCSVFSLCALPVFVMSVRFPRQQQSGELAMKFIYLLW